MSLVNEIVFNVRRRARAVDKACLTQENKCLVQIYLQVPAMRGGPLRCPAAGRWHFLISYTKVTHGYKIVLVYALFLSLWVCGCLSLIARNSGMMATGWYRRKGSRRDFRRLGWQGRRRAARRKKGWRSLETTDILHTLSLL